VFPDVGSRLCDSFLFFVRSISSGGFIYLKFMLRTSFSRVGQTMRAGAIFHDVDSTKGWNHDCVFRVLQMELQDWVARCCSMADLERLNGTAFKFFLAFLKSNGFCH